MTVISQTQAPVEAARTATPTPNREVGPIRLIGRGLAYVLLMVAALAALVMIVVPVATGAQTYTVLTSSMAPKYAPGTFIVVKPTPFTGLKVGDIITYQIESGKSGVITHRITAVGSTQSGERVLTTKGDNNSVEDPNAVLEAQVRGKLLYAVPCAGFVASAVGQQRDIVLPVLAVLCIGFGALSMGRGALDKRRSRRMPRHGQ